jgi:hypothetical protein
MFVDGSREHLQRVARFSALGGAACPRFSDWQSKKPAAERDVLGRFARARGVEQSRGG